MSRSNCLMFALSLLWWRFRRFKADPSRPEPYLVLRPSRAGGPFHMLVGTLRGDALSLVSYKPVEHDKEDPMEAVQFIGHVVRGDAR